MRKKITIWLPIVVILCIIILLGIGKFMWPVMDYVGRDHEKYRVKSEEDDWTWAGVELLWDTPEDAAVRPVDDGSRAGNSLRWITGVNYTDKLLYGKTATWWFVLTSDEKTKLLHKPQLFQTENKLKDYLAAQGVQIKKLIEVSVFKAPGLTNGYRFKMSGGQRLDLYRSTSCYAYGISPAGVFDRIIIGQGFKGDPNVYNPDFKPYWFMVDINNDKSVFSTDFNEIASAAGLKPEQIKVGLQNVPVWNGIDLPFKRYTWGPCSKIAHSIQILYEPTDEIGKEYSFVHYILYYKRQNGFIFGKAWHEYFIFNTTNEKTQFFELTKETDWLAELTKYNLDPKDFTGYEDKDTAIAEYERPPWGDSYDKRMKNN